MVAAIIKREERIGWINAPIKRVAVRRLMIRILAYSAMKISANPPALYSTLKPDTNSDSPSAKSKGVRFVSARIDVNQITKRSGQRKIGQVICVCFIRDRSKDRTSRGMGRRIKIMLTSYEIV